MTLYIGQKDKILLTRIPEAADCGFEGGKTSSDPNSCWVRLDRQLKGAGIPCSIESAQLPDGRLSKLPKYVEVKNFRGNRIIKLPIINDENQGRISLGSFPKGNISEFTVVFPDLSRIRFSEPTRPDRWDGQRSKQHGVDIEPASGINFYTKKLLSKLRSASSAQCIDENCSDDSRDFHYEK